MVEMIKKLKAELFKSIAHPTRIQILDFLKEEEKCVCEIIEELVLEQSNVSQHLSVLKKQELIIGRKEGTKILYRVKYLEVLTLIKLSDKILAKKLDEAQEVLDYFKASNNVS